MSTGDVHPLGMKKTAEIEGRNLIGRRLREVRLKQKPEVTLEDLAGRLAARGVTLDRSAIGRIENGNRYVLDYELKAIANALKVHVWDLLR
jgi:transcriptional regulator with XRE-family HTH domain